MEEKNLKQIEAMMTRVVGVFSEDVQHKFEILAEGQQLLSEKIEATRTELKTDIVNLDQRLTVVEARLDQRIGGLEKKVDDVASDLKEHRSDTESHRRGWRVQED